ncbi:MAG TPA: hypothetical protein VI912_05855 [Candidatus Bilamarchaeaceae archaeon]|nr:hypothetical protein [Candidatus Bilamarchaeaceae archaeon]
MNLRLRRGREVVDRRILNAREVVLRSDNKVLVQTFDQHVHPAIEDAIKDNVITLERIPEELNTPAARRHNLLLVDLILWHIFKDIGYAIPCLRHPISDRYEDEYITVFGREHETFQKFRVLDQQPGFDGDSYSELVTPKAGERPSMALLARIIDVAALDTDGVFALVTGSDLGTQIVIPEREWWDATKRNIAESAMFYANIADLFGFPRLVSRIKDFTVKELYGGFWEYVECEMDRLQPEIELSNQIVREIRDEIKKELRKEGIEAEVQIRENGKSPGSLGLKVKNRFEDRLKRAIAARLSGTPKIDLDIRDPTRVDGIFPSDAVSILIDGETAKFVGNGPHLDLEFNGTILPSVVSGIATGTRFIVPGIQTFGSDFAAGRIIVDGFNGSTSEASLKRAAAKIKQGILPRCIGRVLERHGITRHTTSTKDYIQEPKANGYRSIHLDTSDGGEAIKFAPFEWQVKTRTMHKWAEEGDAAHYAYKESGPQTRMVGTALRETVSRMQNGDEPRKVDVREIRLIGVTVNIHGTEKRIRSPEGRRILEILVDAGVDLAQVWKIEHADGRKEGVKLMDELTAPVNIGVTYTRSSKKLYFKPQMAKHLLSTTIPAFDRATYDQLKSIQNSDRDKD